MARITSLTRPLSTAVSTARPILVGIAGRVGTLLPGRSRRTEPSSPETFSPSPSPADAPRPATPTPASIARNVAAPRPSAKQPSAKPRSAPGAKLPVRRPNPST